MALFVTYARAGRIKPHVPLYLAALARESVSTILIVNPDHPAAVPHADVIDLVDRLYLRQSAANLCRQAAAACHDWSRLANPRTCNAAGPPQSDGFRCAQAILRAKYR
jgi:hypothetical protein